MFKRSLAAGLALLLAAGVVCAQQATVFSAPLVTGAGNYSAASLKVAVLLPSEQSRMKSAGDMLLRGVQAANYASGSQADIIVLRCGEGPSLRAVLERAAAEGAMAVIGPLERPYVEQMAAMPWLPLPVIALNSIELEKAGRAAVPRGMLLFSLSMDDDARYVAELAVRSLPELTESGKKPEVLVIDVDRALEKRIAAAYKKKLSEASQPYQEFTADLSKFSETMKYFDSMNNFGAAYRERLGAGATKEERQQQLKQKRENARRRAEAVRGEPRFHTVLLSMNAKDASLLRPRIHPRSRVWAAPNISPGDPSVDAAAASMSHDLRHVTYVESPFVASFDDKAFEETYQTAAPAGQVERKLFAQGADALAIALHVARGEPGQTLSGATGTVSYAMNETPLVTRHGSPVILNGGRIQVLTPEQAVQIKGGQMIREEESEPEAAQE
ncbi:MAG: penicillin-binding protein activator [Duodenibacillus sp.]|nr:penicillin-binding protein activator [Duodenibacillus sp.]